MYHNLSFQGSIANPSRPNDEVSRISLNTTDQDSDSMHFVKEFERKVNFVTVA